MSVKVQCLHCGRVQTMENAVGSNIPSAFFCFMNTSDTAHGSCLPTSTTSSTTSASSVEMGGREGAGRKRGMPMPECVVRGEGVGKGVRGNAHKKRKKLTYGGGGGEWGSQGGVEGEERRGGGGRKGRVEADVAQFMAEVLERGKSEGEGGVRPVLREKDLPVLDMTGFQLSTRAPIKACVERRMGTHPVHLGMCYWRLESARKTLFKGWAWKDEIMQLALNICLDEEQALTALGSHFRSRRVARSPRRFRNTQVVAGGEDSLLGAFEAEGGGGEDVGGVGMMMMMGLGGGGGEGSSVLGDEDVGMARVRVRMSRVSADSVSVEGSSLWVAVSKVVLGVFVPKDNLNPTLANVVSVLARSGDVMASLPPAVADLVREGDLGMITALLVWSQGEWMGKNFRLMHGAGCGEPFVVFCRDAH